jgi:hypothetical protein
MIKSKRIRYAEPVPCMREMRNAYKILIGKFEKRSLGDLSIYERIILKFILKNRV